MQHKVSKIAVFLYVLFLLKPKGGEIAQDKASQAMEAMA